MHVQFVQICCRESALSDCQARNAHLVEEVISYRAQTHEMTGTIAAYRGQVSQLDAYAHRSDWPPSLLHISARNAS